MSVFTVRLSVLPIIGEFEIRLTGRRVACSQGIRGVSIHSFTEAELRIIADEITAQLDRIKAAGTAK
jgi:hypothetical protein